MNGNNEQKQEIDPLKPALEPKTVSRELWEFLKIILIAFVVALPIRYYVAQPFIVKGQSMEPSFEDKEYLIIDELSYQFRQPERGEVVVFRNPNNSSEFYIKRIIGLPFERVEIKNGKITVYKPEDGEEGGGASFVLSEPYLPPDLVTKPDKTLSPGKDEYVVLGDNRLHSSDSRVWGVLNKNFITGRVLFRAWPPEKFGQIPLPAY